MTADEKVREAYRRAVEARTAPPRAGCVSADALLALVRREGREADRLATLDHAMACAPCRAEFELLRSLERAGGEHARAAVEGIRWKRHVAMALAASVVLAVGVGTGRRVLDPDDGPMRSSTDAEIELLTPAVSQMVLAGSPVTFAWRPVPDARSYTVELLTAEGSVAVTTRTSDTVVQAFLADSLPAGDYYWSVRATAWDRSEMRSAARAVRVRK